MAVAERTREFGVMAVGNAARRHVRCAACDHRRCSSRRSSASLSVASVVALFGNIGLDPSRFERLQRHPGLTGIVYPQPVAGNLVGPASPVLASVAVFSSHPAARRRS